MESSVCVRFAFAKGTTTDKYESQNVPRLPVMTHDLIIGVGCINISRHASDRSIGHTILLLLQYEYCIIRVASSLNAT